MSQTLLSFTPKDFLTSTATGASGNRYTLKQDDGPERWTATVYHAGTYATSTSPIGIHYREAKAWCEGVESGATKKNHDAEPAAKAPEPSTVHAGPRSCESDAAGTGKLKWVQDPVGVWTAGSRVHGRLYMIKYSGASYTVTACGDVYGTTSWTLSGAMDWCQGIEDNAIKLSRQAPQKQDEPSAYAIECEPGDPKMHSLSFWKKDLEKIVTAHGGKVVPLYRRP